MHEIFTKNPYELLDQKVAQAHREGVLDSNAMTLATITPEGKPSARIVLYKGRLNDGLSFFTNYESRKGTELLQTPSVCAVFFWPQLHQQVRVDGTVVRMSREDSEGYFSTRPRESQIGAWASEQSRVLGSKSELEQRALDLQKKFEGLSIPCPPHWGGFLIIPEVMEFWIGRPGRLHDRFIFEKSGLDWKHYLRQP